MEFSIWWCLFLFLLSLLFYFIQFVFWWTCFSCTWVSSRWTFGSLVWCIPPYLSPFHERFKMLFRVMSMIDLPWVGQVNFTLSKNFFLCGSLFHYGRYSSWDESLWSCAEGFLSPGPEKGLNICCVFALISSFHCLAQSGP